MALAVVFDLDGTLIDSAPDVRAALNRLLAEEGRPQLTLPQVQELVGEGARPLIERAWAATGESAAADAVSGLIERYLGHYRAHPADHTHIYDGVVALLEGLRAQGALLGICTNKPSGMTGIVLDALDLTRHFRAVVGGDHPRRKPDGDHILETLRRMDAKPEDAVYVGDSITDVQAARHAGIPVVAVDWGYARMPVEKLRADRLISHFRDLTAAIGELRP
ncbi:Phosphoglycolate phosphatase [Paramagnetospirillum magnetotacticum MS-1]|uniref:Phosphoglycolate phosphatase n=1 Tax=Paramagnetospirillum magnetotacticum MS-1 TaxID=272627 RepID=A0A0C2YDD6_PARME|nr:phosphoglycolate phosphatase [Paramagnetospirillum magnetotacticum]KIL97714.1 Phosphoglycolate phosphatase [Paramagnetospirillum magnetotacticum MS-1]